MYLKDLANIIYTEGTASEKTQICIKTQADKRILWKGNAADLKNWDNIKGWIVVEVLIDYSDEINQADYNKDKIVTVI